MLCRDKRYKHLSIKHLSDLLGGENTLVSTGNSKGLGETILEKAQKEAHRFAFKSSADKKAEVKGTECSDSDFH